MEGEKSDRRLCELGYRNDFRRDMSPLGVLGLSFCAVGILTGMSSAFQTALFSGGPLGLFWGWNVRACSVIWVKQDSRILIADREFCVVVDMQCVYAADRTFFGRDM